MAVVKKDQHFASANTLPPADEVFMASLRSDKAVKGRPGWNDDLSAPQEPARRRSSDSRRPDWSSAKEGAAKPSPRVNHHPEAQSAESGQLKSRCQSTHTSLIS